MSFHGARRPWSRWDWGFWVLIALYTAALVGTSYLTQRSASELEDRVKRLETRAQGAERVILAHQRQLDSPIPDQTVRVTKEVNSAHNRLDKLADALDVLCHWTPGREHCPVLVEESRKR